MNYDQKMNDAVRMCIESSWKPDDEIILSIINELERIQVENKQYQSVFDIQRNAIEILEKEDRFDIGWDCAIPLAAATLELIFLDCREESDNILLTLDKQNEIVDTIRNIMQPEDK